jgi:hypothetical protein
MFLVATAAVRLPGHVPSPDFARDWPPLARWDSGWYWQIATGGYTYDAKELQNNVAFYPLYPLMVRAISKTTGMPIFGAGIFLSLVSLTLALVLFADLVRDWAYPGETAFLSVTALLCFPTAFFFAAFYSESLFLLSTITAIWGAQRRRWAISGIGAAAAGMTRFNGFLILLPVAAYGWAEWRRTSKFGKPVMAFGMGIAGLAAYPLYLWRRFGDPLFYLHDHARGGWPQHPGAPWRILGDLPFLLRERLKVPAPDGRLNFWVRIGALALFVVLTVLLARRRRFPEALYLGASLLLILSTGSLESIHRYLVVLFPGFFALGDFLRQRPVAAFAYLFVSTCLQVILLVHYANWVFVA